MKDAVRDMAVADIVGEALELRVVVAGPGGRSHRFVLALPNDELALEVGLGLAHAAQKRIAAASAARAEQVRVLFGGRR